MCHCCVEWAAVKLYEALASPVSQAPSLWHEMLQRSDADDASGEGHNDGIMLELPMQDDGFFAATDEATVHIARVLSWMQLALLPADMADQLFCTTLSIAVEFDGHLDK